MFRGMVRREGARITQRKQSALLLIDCHRTGAIQAEPPPKTPRNVPARPGPFSGGSGLLPGAPVHQRGAVDYKQAATYNANRR